jgi:hypothetical protein
MTELKKAQEDPLLNTKSNINKNYDDSRAAFNSKMKQILKDFKSKPITNDSPVMKVVEVESPKFGRY